MANSIYLGGGIKSAFCGGNVKEIHLGTNKLFPSGGGGKIKIGENYYNYKKFGDLLWLTENIREITPTSIIYSTTYDGRYYQKSDFNENILPLVPDGWRLPSREDCENLLNNTCTKPSYYWANAQVLVSENLGGTNSTGFNFNSVNKKNPRARWDDYYNYQCNLMTATYRYYFTIDRRSFRSEVFGIVEDDWFFNIRLCKDA